MSLQTRSSSPGKARDLLARRVKQLMSERGLNRSELARRVKLSQPQVSQFLNGKRNLSLESLDALSVVLATPVYGLFSDPAVIGSSELEPEDAVVLTSYRAASDKVRRCVRSMLDIEDRPDESLIADALVRAARQIAGGASPDRPVAAGAGHRRAAGRRA